MTTLVDATDTEAWRYLDLDSGEAVDPSTSGAWDLGFRRFLVRTNGGVSGDGGVRVAALDGAAFDDRDRAPDTGWRTDMVDGDVDDDTEADNAFNNGTDDWYDYEPSTHTLTPKSRVYVVVSTEGNFYKVEMLAYYDDAGSPAFVRFRWARVNAASMLPDAGPVETLDAGTPDPDAGIEIPADAIHIDANGTDWAYFRIGEGLVSVADPSSSTAWDLAFHRVDIRTNSGTSGSGVGGARVERDVAFDALTETSTYEFRIDRVAADATESSSPPFDGADEGEDPWYIYHLATHTVTPRDQSYVVRTAEGGYARLRIWDWTDGHFAISASPIERTLERREVSIDATNAEAWTYLSVRDGALVSVSDASVHRGWDVGFSTTRVRTNGGTSGPGEGSAFETEAATFDALTTVPTEGFVLDVDTLTAGPPGSPTFSGNGPLSAWFDYDEVTHRVSPRGAVFAVRASDGSVAKLEVLSYEGGVYRIALVYAGPLGTEL